MIGVPIGHNGIITIVHCNGINIVVLISVNATNYGGDTAEHGAYCHMAFTGMPTLRGGISTHVLILLSHPGGVCLLFLAVGRSATCSESNMKSNLS